jgi:hypothetical protein
MEAESTSETSMNSSITRRSNSEYNRPHTGRLGKLKTYVGQFNVKCLIFLLLQNQISWAIFTALILIKIDVSENGICLRPQAEHPLLGPFGRVRPDFLSTVSLLLVLKL